MDQVVQRKPWSRREYYSILAFLWIFTAAYLAGVIWVYCFWEGSLVYKIIVGIPFIFFRPDIRELFVSHEKYLLEQRQQKSDATAPKREVR